eukprot:TRINITY_DN29575_c0_g1_i1.p1 TRINITY_DN29575_c0_g1~~TRINITY_DN29575_c0_g1_i1.p1  ORF type:complete len:241 (+),score=39.58 TRINITY_DN29575_c0_g1_i1:111-833(+)
MEVSSYVPEQSWAQVAADAHALVAQRAQPQESVLDPQPKPAERPSLLRLDNELGPGQYTFNEVLTRGACICPRFLKANRFAKDPGSEMSTMDPEQWAESLGRAPSPMGSHSLGDGQWALAKKSLPRDWRSRIRRPVHQLVECFRGEGEPIVGHSVQLPKTSDKATSSQLSGRKLGKTLLRASHSAGSLVRGSPRRHKSSMALSTSADQLPGEELLGLQGAVPPGKPVAPRKAASRRKKTK